jgi:hypothetical protein
MAGAAGGAICAWGAPIPCGGPPNGEPPGIGGATPTIVPLSLLGGPAAPAAPGTADPGGRGPGTGAAGAGGGVGTGRAAPGAGAAEPGWFIINIVPLNFGAAAPLTLKLHFEHVAAVSGFWVPQFGQNTPGTSRRGA